MWIQLWAFNISTFCLERCSFQLIPRVPNSSSSGTEICQTSERRGRVVKCGSSGAEGPRLQKVMPSDPTCQKDLETHQSKWWFWADYEIPSMFCNIHGLDPTWIESKVLSVFLWNFTTMVTSLGLTPEFAPGGPRENASAWRFCLHRRVAQSWNHFLMESCQPCEGNPN